MMSEITNEVNLVRSEKSWFGIVSQKCCITILNILKLIPLITYIWNLKGVFTIYVAEGIVGAGKGGKNWSTKGVKVFTESI